MVISFQVPVYHPQSPHIRQHTSALIAVSVTLWWVKCIWIVLKNLPPA
jgi:hypothetical protein